MIPPSVCDVLPPHSDCRSSYRQPLALRPEIRPDRAGCGRPVAAQLAVKQEAITHAFQQLKNNPHKALQIAQREIAQSHNAHLQLQILTLKARALFELKRYNQCLSFINELPCKLQNEKGLCMAKGRALEELGRLPEALDVFRQLYDRYATGPKDQKMCGLVLVRALQRDGRPAKLDEGAEILKQLRRRAANNKDNTPCHDKEIELALAILLQQMGGKDNLQAALAIFTTLRQRMAGRPHTPCHNKEIEVSLGRLLQQMEGKDNLQAALAIFTTLRERMAGRPDTPCHNKEIELSLGRLLQQMEGKDNLQAALAIVTTLRERAAGQPQTPCRDKGIELALARLLQQMGGKNNLQAALAILKDLASTTGEDRASYHDKEILLTLGRHLQLLGGKANLQAALTIFIRLRRQAASGLPNTPCDDKEIELALGRCFQLMGDSANLQAALAIFTRLRQQAASGRSDTPCDNKEIELALGRHLQLMGGKANLQAALTIFIRLRRQAASGRPDTPCDDKEIELTLGRHLQLMGGSANLQAALAIFTRLCQCQAQGEADTPCGDTETELALAGCLAEMGRWQEYDALGLCTEPWAHHTIHLCHSIRYFREVIEQTGNMDDRTSLLGLAIHYACQAIDTSDYHDASSFSQLAHCCRACAYMPPECRQQFGIEETKENIDSWVKLFFDEACRLEPGRTDERTYSEQWRKKEAAWLQAAERMTQRSTTATTDRNATADL